MMKLIGQVRPWFATKDQALGPYARHPALNNLSSKRAVAAEAHRAKYDYDPYGRTISASGTLAAANRYRFSSKAVHANTGMYYYGYRFYDPYLQRWLNRDPRGERGDRNLYGFIRNNSLNWIDKLGLQTEVIPIVTEPEPSPTVTCDGNGNFEIDYAGFEDTFVQPCIKAHEEQHIEDYKKRFGQNACQGVPKGEVPFPGPDYNAFLSSTECKAYRASNECIRKLPCMLGPSSDELLAQLLKGGEAIEAKWCAKARKYGYQ